MVLRAGSVPVGALALVQLSKPSCSVALVLALYRLFYPPSIKRKGLIHLRSKSELHFWYFVVINCITVILDVAWS